MGIPINEEDGWIRNRGLRIIGGETDSSFPGLNFRNTPDSVWYAPATTSTRSSPATP